MKFIAHSRSTGDRYLSSCLQEECKSTCKIESHEEARQHVWVFWMVGWLFDWFIFKHAGQAGGRSQWLSVGVTLVIFPSSVS